MSDVEMDENVKDFSCQDCENFVKKNVQMKMLSLTDTAVINFKTKDSNFYGSARDSPYFLGGTAKMFMVCKGCLLEKSRLMPPLLLLLTASLRS